MRMHFRMLALLPFALCLPAGAVDGTNLPGSDYANFDAPSAFVCRTSCGGEAKCQAYTWVKPGVQGPGGHCWLKSAEPAIVKDNCCDSAHAPLHRAAGHAPRPSTVPDPTGGTSRRQLGQRRGTCTRRVARPGSWVRTGCRAPSGPAGKNHAPVDSQCRSVSARKLRGAPVRTTPWTSIASYCGRALRRGPHLMQIQNRDPTHGVSRHSHFSTTRLERQAVVVQGCGRCAPLVASRSTHGAHHCDQQQELHEGR